MARASGCCKFTILFFFLGILSLTSLSVTAAAGRPKTVAEKLRDRNIGLTKPELIAALHNSDSDVRGLAAQMLADEHAYDSVKSIDSALAVETVPTTRINLAFALAQLGPPEGLRSLQQACHDDSLPGYLRARATDYILHVEPQNRDCLRDLFGMLMSADSDTVTQSISVLSHSALTSDERDEYLRGLVRVLTSPDPGLRLTSSHALADLGGSTAVQALEMALAKEEDKTVRMAMERDVHRLKEKR